MDSRDADFYEEHREREQRDHHHDDADLWIESRTLARLPDPSQTVAGCGDGPDSASAEDELGAVWRPLRSDPAVVTGIGRGAAPDHRASAARIGGRETEA